MLFLRKFYTYTLTHLHNSPYFGSIDYDLRPGVPFEINHCCEMETLNMFQMDTIRDRNRGKRGGNTTHGIDDGSTTYLSCHTPSGNLGQKNQFWLAMQSGGQFMQGALILSMLVCPANLSIPECKGAEVEKCPFAIQQIFWRATKQVSLCFKI